MADKNKEERNKKIRRAIRRIQMGTLMTNNTSGVRGVTYHKAYDKWYARITVNGRTYGLGYYEHFNDAVRARKNAEKRLTEGLSPKDTEA